MKKKNIIRVLSLLLCLMTLASLTTLTAFASDHAAVDSETTEDITATWIYNPATGELTGYFPDTGETLVYTEAKIPSRVQYFSLHAYEYENTIEIDGESYILYSEARQDCAVWLEEEYGYDARLFLTEDGQHQANACAEPSGDYFSLPLIDRYANRIQFQFSSLSPDVLNHLRTLPADGQITRTLHELKSEAHYELLGRIYATQPFAVTLGYIFEIEETLYYLDATTLSDACFNSEGGFNPMKTVTVTLTPLTDELSQTVYEGIDDMSQYSPYTTYEADTEDDDTGVIIVGLIFLYMTAIPAGLTLPLFPFIAGLILPHLRATGKKKRWYALSVISALWMILTVILLIVITVATILML